MGVPDSNQPAAPDFSRLPLNKKRKIKNFPCFQNVVVMCHGDRIDNFEPLWMSQAARPWDPPLVQPGKDRAFCTGTKLRSDLGFQINRIFVSPFIRCVETAVQVVTALSASEDPCLSKYESDQPLPVDPSKLKVSIEYGLCEMLNKEAIRGDMAPKDGQQWGFNIAELEALFPAGTVDQTVERVYKELPQWGESVMGARARYAEVIQALADKYPSENLLLVTHGEGVGSSISLFLEGATVYEVNYCAYSKLRRPIFDKDQLTTAGKFEVVKNLRRTGLSYLLETMETGKDADYNPDFSKATYESMIQGFNSLNIKKNLSRLPSLSKGSHDDNNNHYKQQYQTTGSDDSNPTESLLLSSSPHADPDQDELGNGTRIVFQGSVDSDPSVSPLPCTSTQADTDCNVLDSAGSDDSNFSYWLLQSTGPRVSTNSDERGNLASEVFQGSVDSNPSVSPLPCASTQADTDCDGLDSAGSDDSNLSVLLLQSTGLRVSTNYDERINLASEVGRSGSNHIESVAFSIYLQNDFAPPRHRARVTALESTFIFVGLSLEMLSAAFDQLSSTSKPCYALIGLLLAIAAVLTCIWELIYNGTKDRDASPNSMVFFTLPDIFGLGLAVIQCVCSAVQYYFLHHHHSNPMKLSPVPLFCFMCLVAWKLNGN